MSDFRYPYCRTCLGNFPMREEMYNDLEECGNTFYCPQGHPLVIHRSTIVSELRSLKRRVSYRDDTISRLVKHSDALRGVQTRQRNRLLKGACPYCNKYDRVTYKTPSYDLIAHIQQHHSPKKKS